MTTDLETAAEVIGIGRPFAYDLAKRGAFPVRMLVSVAGSSSRCPICSPSWEPTRGRSTDDGLRRDRGGRRAADRVLYRIDDEACIVTVVLVTHRRDAYRTR